MDQDLPLVLLEIEELKSPPTSTFISHIERVFDDKAKELALGYAIQPVLATSGDRLIDKLYRLRQSVLLLSANYVDAHLCLRVGMVTFKIRRQETGELLLPTFLLMSGAQRGKALDFLIKPVSASMPAPTHQEELLRMASILHGHLEVDSDLVRLAVGFFSFIELACQRMIKTLSMESICSH